MYKVCLLDDQPFVRQGLREIIDWNSLNCKIVAEWGTGVNAMQEIERIQPDILISDIVMPGLDGLTLMDMLNQSGSMVQVIFLSAHRNFEYAQRAIDLGAVDYLVKPTDPKEVIRAVMKCIKRLSKSQADKESGIDMQITEETKKEQEILSLLIHENQKIEPVFTDQHPFYSVAAVRFDDASFDMPLLQESVRLLRRKLKQTNCGAILPVIDKVLVVFCAEDSLQLKKQTIEWAEEIQFWHRQLLDVSVSVGISQVLQGTASLHKQYVECLKALEMSFYYGSNAIIPYEPPQEADFADRDGEAVRSEHQESKLLDAIKLGDEETIGLLTEQWFEEFIKQKASEHDIKFRIYKWVFYAAIHVPLVDEDKREWERQAQKILAANSLHEIKQLLRAIIGLMMGRFKMDARDSHEVVIHQIEKYIEGHYHDQDTSLTAVAEHVHLSPNYVSRLIKRKIGKTFTEWLNEYRLEQAKTLLQNPKNKSYWVAERVGIPDARYFSQLFRKHTNLTPSEYKSRFLHENPE